MFHNRSIKLIGPNLFRIIWLCWWKPRKFFIPNFNTWATSGVFEISWKLPSPSKPTSWTCPMGAIKWSALEFLNSVSFFAGVYFKHFITYLNTWATGAFSRSPKIDISWWGNFLNIYYWGSGGRCLQKFSDSTSDLSRDVQLLVTYLNTWGFGEMFEILWICCLLADQLPAGHL